MTLPVAVDAMGGDKAPADVVRGARQAADEFGVEVILVGRADEIAAVDPGDLAVLDCREVIGMHDEAGAAVRTKKDSSLVRAAELVRDGKASAMVSGGNTGAGMAAALLRMGRIRGVARPAIATPIPVPGASPTILLDSGANADCQPAWLVQFAQMGSAYCATRFGVERPKVALLSIGEEDTKGSTLVKEARELLREAPGLHFVGNVEGRDLMSDAADVVVTDGFTGNVTLKTMEGLFRWLQGALFGVMTATPDRQAAFDVLWPALQPLIAELEPDSYGGAVMLGVDGLCIISHGSSSPTAIANAVALARDMAAVDLVGALTASVSASSAS